ncbi:NAD(P)H-dependent oxidoreductase [Streptomyces sp. NPDC047042]|uniref:NADPH-dependent FMN reductase n=1 Tax=Streptomyces sp. NPDC047042 TaxID=3154807 RepID=UPI0033FF5B73
MAHDPLRLAVVAGSGRPGSTGATVAHWFAGQARRYGGLRTDIVDLAAYTLPAEPVAATSPEVAAQLADLTPRLALADVFVLVTPEYNRSFPASLKALIDWHDSEWQAKPVGFVSYGGRSGGLRAVEHLRQVLGELHAVAVRDTVSFHGVWDLFDSEGNPRDREGCAVAAKALLDQLAWWGTVLREGRTRHPYLHGARPALTGGAGG